MLQRATRFLLFAIGATAAGPVCAQVITTIAGTNFTFPPSPLPALNAPLGTVTGVAVDSQGNVYVADPANNIVARISSAGTLTVVAGNGIAGFSGDGGPATSASLDLVGFGGAGVAVDSAGDLYIADTHNSRIRKVSGGTITTVAGNGDFGFSGDGGPAVIASLNSPHGVAVDLAGNLYIADTNNDRIRRVSAGTITTVAGGGHFAFVGDGGPATSASLFGPEGVAVDSVGNLYIADTVHGLIRKVSGGTITTVAGGGTILGDGGLATNATLTSPVAIAVDSAGNNLYIADYGNSRIRRVAGETITTFAGNGSEAFLGDGGLATSASLNFPYGVALDSAGNLYIADPGSERVRKVSGGIITTIAGDAGYGFSGDGGASNGATLSAPSGVTVDSVDNVYIADSNNNRIRKISDGTISTVAGTGDFGFSGDGGSATRASLDYPTGVAADSTGNLYIVDANNNRIRKVSNGMITTVAGNGNADFSGDGGPATSAALQPAGGIALDSAGNLYIADTFNNRIRKVSSGGIISTVVGGAACEVSADGGSICVALTTPYGVAVDSADNLYITDTGNGWIWELSGARIKKFAGNGTQGFSGDGFSATSAALNSPTGVAVDSAGNLYIVDANNNRIRKVSNGMITTVAGNGNADFSGDGGPATSAALNPAGGVAVDSDRNLYLADTNNNRIRKVLAGAVSYQAKPANLSFAATSGGRSPAAQTINLSSSILGLAFTATSATWLSVSPSTGTIPAGLLVSVDPTGLAPNTYQGMITITAPNASPSTQTVTVSFTITAGTTPSSLAVSSQSLLFSLTQGASPTTAQFTISNTGSGSTRYAASVTTATGGNWLQISSSSGSVSATTAVSLTVTATPGTLTPGTYSGTITVAGPDTGQTTLTVAVILAITPAPGKILLSQLGFTFTAVAQGGTVLPQTLGILNAGAGTLSYSVQTTTQSGGSGWLSVSANSGTVTRPFLDVSDIDVSVNTSQLPPPGIYYGKILVSAAGASNSPQTAVVILNVLPPGSTPGPDVRPTGLVFTGAVGAENPGSQNVTVANVTANPTTFGAGVTYVSGAGWINSQPTNFTVPPDAPEPIVVQPDFSSLTAGVRRAALTVAFDDGTIRTVSILSVLAPAGTVVSGAAGDRPRATSGCTPSRLQPLFTATGLSLNLTVGFPAFIAATIVDDCGSPLTSGSVMLSFDNGDQPLSLINTQNGTWTTSWQPSHPANNVTLTLTASVPSLNLTGLVQVSAGGVQQGSQSPPMLTGSPLGAGAVAAGSFAPGDIILLKGIGLADGQASSTSSPLKNQLAGASVVIGQAGLISLLYADAGQVVGLVPLDTPVNTSPSLILLRDAAQGVQIPVIISATNPAILTADGSGKGQGTIYKGSGAATTLADAANPVKAGDSIIIYCTGLGVVDASGNASNKPILTIGGAAAQISYAGIALAANYPPGGAPTLLGLVSSSLGGLYQITAAVPAGLQGGPAQVIITSAGQASQSNVTLVIAGSTSGATPAITSIDTAGGFSTIAQNGWMEIKGSNLAPASVGTGVVWSSAPEFATGHMPTQLSGVSATVNGKSAFVYFVSPTQINVLPPLDSTTGSVQVVVTNNSVSSTPFTVTERTVAPSFLLFGATKYIVATHPNYSLAGPASLSSPGYPFTPVSPSEIVTFYAVGFGLPSTALVNGSATQSGSLPTLPVITIGGTQANVSFAGVISPGLYQFNVVIPSNAANGDNVVTCTYGGLSTPAGDLITVQR